MIYALLRYIVPYGVPWLIIFNTIYCQNGFGTMVTSWAEGSFWVTLLYVLSFAASILSAGYTGGITSIPLVKIGGFRGREYFEDSNGNIDSLPSGGMFLAFLVINYFKCLLLAPFYLVLGIIRCFLPADEDELPPSTVRANILALAAVVLAIFPFSAQAWTSANFDCRDLEYTLVDVSSQTTQYESCTYFDIEIRYPEKELSGIECRLYIYVDGEKISTMKLKEKVNPSEMGLVTIKPGSGEDVDSLLFRCDVIQRQKNKIDLQTLYEQRSDRLLIEVEFIEATFHKGLVKADEQKYVERIGKTTVYPASEHIEKAR